MFAPLFATGRIAGDRNCRCIREHLFGSGGSSATTNHAAQ
jgi:hypothetical protein